METVNEISLPALDDQNLPHLPFCWYTNWPSHFPFRKYPRIGVDIQLEDRPCSPYLGGLDHPDDHGCSPLDVSSEERVSSLDHRARGDDAICGVQCRHGDPKPLRAFLAVWSPSLPPNPERDGFTISQPIIFSLPYFPEGSSPFGLEFEEATIWKFIPGRIR